MLKEWEIKKIASFTLQYYNEFGGNIMEKICPVCNNLKKHIYTCEKCSAIMEDKGIIQEYFDDYTADMDINDNNQFCVHIYQCSNCNFYERINVNKIFI